jgi:signal transduction histidine kinase
MSETLFFKTNTLLKNLVGKDLINDDNIAVIELVKNSYDANSPTVLLQFEHVVAPARAKDSKTQPRIVVVDCGVGMDYDDICDKWLNIAYSEKKSSTSADGGYYAGNKGVGRFSCDRLGQELDILTRKRNGKLFHLQISWPAFEVEGRKDLTIQQVGVTLSEVSEQKALTLAGQKMPHAGTILVISLLRSAWDREKLLGLKRSLEKFLNPNELFIRKKFQITLQATEFLKQDSSRDYVDRINGVVENQVFAKLKFNTTMISCTIPEHGRTMSTELSHDGKLVLRLEEKNSFSLKNVKASIYYLNPYKKAYFKRQTGRRSIDFGSIFLFLNGFRVAPYGDRGDDWLGLDVRKTQGTTRYLSSRDLIGRIEVVDKEDRFTPISSREGLKKTGAFLQLKDGFAMEAIKRLERFVVEGLNWDSIPEQLRDAVRDEEGLDWKDTSEEYVESWDKKRERIAITIMTFMGASQDRIIKFWFNPSLLEGLQEERAADVERLLGSIDGFDSSQIDSSLKHGLSQLRKLVSDKEAEARAAKVEATGLRLIVAEKEKNLRKLTEETATYRAQTLFLKSVASVDATSLMAFHHEILSNANIISNHMGKAMKALREQGGGQKLMQNLERISLANKRITAIAQFATKANFKSSSDKELTDIPAFIQQYVESVTRDFMGGGIVIDVANSVVDRFEIKVRRIELSILIDNLVHNSIKAQASRIVVEITQRGANTLIVTFSDNGKGLSAAIKSSQEIFEMGVTTTGGSGLGLYHCREIVRGLGGTISAVPLKPSGLQIKVSLTK